MLALHGVVAASTPKITPQRRGFLCGGIMLALTGRAAGLLQVLGSTSRSRVPGGPMLVPNYRGELAFAFSGVVSYQQCRVGRYTRWAATVAPKRPMSPLRGYGGRRVRYMCSAPAPAELAEGSSAVPSDEEELLSAQIVAKGDVIRKLKSEGGDKVGLKPHIEELLELKQLFVKTTGREYGPSKDPAKEKEKAKEQETNSKKAAKEARRLAKMAADAGADPLEALGLEKVVYPSKEALEAGNAHEPSQRMGDYAVLMSSAETGRVFTSVDQLGVEGGPGAGDEVWVRARVHQLRAKGGSAFLVLREHGVATVQALHFKDKENLEESKKLIKYLASLPLETVVDVQGILAEAAVKSCTQNNVEIQISRAYAVSRATPMLPFQVEDASRSEKEVEESQESDRPFPRLGQELRLDNRWLDLRTPANNAIMRVQSGVCQLYRESLYAQGFMEIHTPKIIPGESEGGAGVFTTDYFGKTACLAQSPQLYKQMAISADLQKVFEVGPVFRAENSNTRRHLCEFTGLDLEMAITDHYNEVIGVLHNAFKHVFTGLEERFGTELKAIREQFPSEPVAFSEEPLVVHWEDAIQMLREAGHEAEDFADLSGAQELALGSLVKQAHGTDFFFLDRFPADIRPFYTMPCPDDNRYSNSYDLLLRGQEICSGAQRCHDPLMLEEILNSKGVPLEPLKDYLDAFRHGCTPHGGGGIGLERVVFLYLGLDNVRKASMFPRDPNRCTP
ncbi:unnamed protein product [Discosporangium mesarthrocarpum]